MPREDGPYTTCPAEGCPTSIPTKYFACHKHWRDLPYSLRAKIISAYHRMRDRDTVVAASAEHRTCRAKAVEFWRNRERKGPVRT